MSSLKYLIAGLTLLSTAAVNAEEQLEIVEHKSFMDHGDGHLMDMDGAMVMGQNKDKLPGGCDRVSEDAEITVHAGHKYTKEFPGTMFGFDKHEWKVKPCTRLTVHFINEDRVRHQWMMHGLPKYMYDKGMFHLEVTGPAKVSGTLILPKEDRTYLVHCDIAQHMEKGMKGQLIVGKGGATFPTIPGVTDAAIPDDYSGKTLVEKDAKLVSTPSSLGEARGNSLESASSGATPGKSSANTATGNNSGGGTTTFAVGLVLGLIGTPFVAGRMRERFQGMSSQEIAVCVIKRSQAWLDQIIGWIGNQLRGLRK